MWFSFWRSRDRYSLDELRFLIDQLMKVQNVNEANKDFVIEALRSIAELITYGDQHDNSYFEFFMEKQVLGEFVRVLKVSRTLIVSLQILQSMSIMIQNIENEHSLYYIFSNEHVNYLITYSFDFSNEELLSYYISFLRAIGGKLNRGTISLLVKTQNDEVVSFPLYVEAIRFAFHLESMIRTAVRALTLNVYHVGDDAVNRFVASPPQAEYFMNLVNFFRNRCFHLNQIVSDASKNQGLDSTSSISSVVDEIEDNLYYFSDVISAGIPDVGKLIMENILRLLIFPSVLPSLMIEQGKGCNHESSLVDISSLYLLCCVLRIVKIKDLANIVAASLLCSLHTCPQNCDVKPNGILLGRCSLGEKSQNTDENNGTSGSNMGKMPSTVPTSSSHALPQDRIMNHDSISFTPWDVLLSFITTGNDVQVSGSLSVLATLLQTKELNESMVDALGILPQRKQRKKKLLQEELVGEDSGDEQLFSSQGTEMEDSFTTELDIYFQKLKNYGGVSCQSIGVGMNPHVHRYQVLRALVALLCRSNISAETLWDCGWLLRQLLPYSEAEYIRKHLRLLKESLINCTICVLEETRGIWSDLLKTVICDEWIKCKRAMEASSPRKDPKCILLSSHKPVIAERTLHESSFSAGERTCETVKVFVLLHYLQSFLLGNVLPEQPPLVTEVETPENSRAKSVGIKSAPLKPNTEINLVDAVPCRIAFERGRERHFYLLALSVGFSGWLVLLDDLPLKPHHGVVRVVAPLAGCNPRIDGKNSRWLHLRIRPSSFPFTDTSSYTAHGKVKSKALVDGRWTLAFRDEESCKYALNMILEEINLQSRVVEKTLQPLLVLDVNSEYSLPSPSEISDEPS